MDHALKIKLILASASPRRQSFFRDLGWDFEIKASEVEEKYIEGEQPEEMVRRLAAEKALDVCNRADCAGWVVGADTTVCVGGAILGKPMDEHDALRMIMMLQGRTHTVMTGVAVITPEVETLSSVAKTDVTFRKMTEDEARAYVEQDESMDKAGTYAIQGRGTLLVERINGCYFNVVGLPLELLSTMLTWLGWPLSDQWRLR